MVRTLAVLSAGLLGCAAAPPAASPPATPATTAPAAPDPAAASRILLCAEIGLVTSSGREPTRSVPADALAAEGARLDVFVDGAMTRIHAELLGETERQTVDYRFLDGQLVCADEMSTSLHTVMGGKLDGSGPPPFWRVDFRVFDASGALVHARFDEAPGPDEKHRSPDETVEFAKQLLALST